MDIKNLRELVTKLKDDPTKVSNDDLAAARQAIQTKVDAVRAEIAEKGATTDTVQLLEELAGVKQDVATAQTARAADAAKTDAEAQRLLEGLDAPDPEPTPGEGDDQDGDAGTKGDDTDGGESQPAERELEAVAASGDIAKQIAAGIAAGMTQVFAAQQNGTSGNAAPAGQPQGRTARGISAHSNQATPRGGEVIRAEVYAGSNAADSARLTDSVELAREVHNLWKGPYQAKNFSGRMPVAHVQTTYPESRQLGTDATTNFRRMEQATGADALVAAGGLCAPLETLYDIDVIGSADRPIKGSALVGFSVERGGITYRPHTSAAAAVHGAGVWSMEDDEAGTGEKACYVVECPGMEEEVVEAIYSCLEFSNITSMFDPESTAANVQQAAIAHARLAENRLLAKMAAGSKLLTGAKVVGATRDILVNLDKTVAYYRNRHRITDALPLTWVAPGWVKSLMRADLARQMAAGDWAEALAPADSLINSWFSARGVTPVWHLDGPSGVDEVQTLTITGTPTGGTFTLSFDGETTAPIAYNASAAQVKSALVALPNVHADDITTAGGALPGTPVTITFGSGEYDGSNVPQMTASGASLTGGSSPAAAISTTTGGGGAITVQGTSIASQTYGNAAAASAIPGFPGQIDSLLYTPGSWLFLDGGSLDLGLVRDSTLNSKNRYRQFMETFEGAAFRGIESLRLVMSVEPTGETVGTISGSGIND